jgi:hypothetical protein
VDGDKGEEEDGRESRRRKETANDDRLWPVLTMRSGVDGRCGG